MLRISGLIWGLTLATSGLALGQAVVQETQTTTTTPAGANTEIRKVSQLIGSSVRLQGTDNFGRVEDAVLDNNGAINYLVVSNGGRYVMMPWNAGNFDYGQRVVTYNITPQAVQPLFFQPNAWPNLSDQQFTNRMSQVFPGTGVVRRDALRPVGPAPSGPGPGPTVVKEKVKEKPNGEVKVKEKVK